MTADFTSTPLDAAEEAALRQRIKVIASEPPIQPRTTLTMRLLATIDDQRKDAQKGWYEAKVRGEILDVIAPGWRRGGDMDQMRTLAASHAGCGDPFHTTDTCPSCGLADTGYDRGYRDGFAAALDEALAIAEAIDGAVADAILVAKEMPR
jgi:hypothetical protein